MKSTLKKRRFDSESERDSCGGTTDVKNALTKNGVILKGTVLTHKRTYLKDPVTSDFYFIDKPEN